MKRHFHDVPLWLRIYWPACCLIAVVILLLSFRILASASAAGLQREIDSSLDKHRMFGDSLTMYADTFTNVTGDEFVQSFLPNAVRNYARYYTDQKSFIAMSDKESRTQFSNMTADMKAAIGLSPAEDRGRSYVIRRIGPQTILFVSGWIAIDGHSYRLDYGHDITDLVQTQRALGVEVSIWLSSGLFVLAVLLYVLLRRALRPLDQLSAQAKSLAQGMQTQLIEVQRRDEIGRLAGDFNHMAESIQANTELLRRTIVERETFIASLAHEVKTPLTSIMGYASLLRSCDLNEEDTALALSRIHSESKRLDELSRSLLELFRIGDGRLISKEELHLPALIEELRSICAPSLSAKRQTLATDVSIDRIVADRGLLLVLLCNLVENASKASGNGSTIDVVVYPESTFILFQVNDSGCGIAEQDLRRIFEPFYMADPARDKESNGYGLGLTLCRAIAEAHNGLIRIESRIGEGTTAYVHFPVDNSSNILTER